MKIKLRLLKITIIALSVAVTYQLVSPTFLSDTNAYAAGDLTVNWGVPEGSPIFVVNNWMPGNSQSRTVTIKNNTATAQPVKVKGVKTTETGNLSQVIDFVISQSGTDIYGGATGAKTLAQFFTDSGGASGVSLGTVSAGVTKSYEFKATFKPSSGNEYQAKNVVFNINIIAPEVLGVCDDKSGNGNRDNRDDRKNKNKEDGHSSYQAQSQHQSRQDDNRNCNKDNKGHKGGDDKPDSHDSKDKNKHDSVFDDFKNACIKIFRNLASGVQNINPQSSKNH